MNIILGSSSNYLPYTAVTIASVCRHMGYGDRGIFHVMHAGDVTEREAETTRANLGRFAEQAQIEFVEVSDSLSLAERIRTSPHIEGSATYLRMYIPQLFQGRFSKALYLDSDLVVCRDVGELFALDMQGNCLAGVEDKLSLSHLRSLGLPENEHYVNAGVLLYDLDRIDQGKMHARLGDVLGSRKKYGIITGDQDLLALIFHDATLYLHPSWNVTPRNSWLGKSYINKRCLRQTTLTREQTVGSLGDPAIIHYIGRVKPWHDAWCYDPLASRWFEYARLTGYHCPKWSAGQKKVRVVSGLIRILTALSRPFSCLLGRIFRWVFSSSLYPAIRRCLGNLRSNTQAAEEKNDLLSLNAERKASSAFSPDAAWQPPYRQIGILPTTVHDSDRGMDVTGYRDFYRILFASPFLLPVMHDSDAKRADALMLDRFSNQEQLRGQIAMLRRAADGDVPMYFVENGPVTGILDHCSCQTTPIKFRRPYSYILDDLSLPFDLTVKSRLRCSLESGETRIDDEARARCRASIDYIVSNRLTRYNFFPPGSESQTPKRADVLVLDQDLDDQSVERGGAGAITFEAMLDAARKENPDADILILPPLSIHNAKGHLAGKRGERIYHIDRPANPYALFESAPKVYTVNSPAGFDALLADRKVIAFGKSMYSGLGLTEDRNGESVARAVCIEELFQTLFFRQAVYFSPYTFERIELESFLREMVQLRDEYLLWVKDMEPLLCPPVTGLPEALDCPICQGARMVSLHSRSATRSCRW